MATCLSPALFQMYPPRFTCWKLEPSKFACWWHLEVGLQEMIGIPQRHEGAIRWPCWLGFPARPRAVSGCSKGPSQGLASSVLLGVCRSLQNCGPNEPLCFITLEALVLRNSNRKEEDTALCLYFTASSGRLRQGDPQFEANLSYKPRSCLKTKTKNLRHRPIIPALQESGARGSQIQAQSGNLAI